MSSPGHNPSQPLVTVSFFMFLRWQQLPHANFPPFVRSRLDPVGRASWPPPRGRTPLHLAALEGHVEVVALLLRSGASLEVTEFGRRPQSCGSHGNVSGRSADDKLSFLVPF